MSSPEGADGAGISGADGTGPEFATDLATAFAPSSGMGISNLAVPWDVIKYKNITSKTLAIAMVKYNVSIKW